MKLMWGKWDRREWKIKEEREWENKREEGGWHVNSLWKGVVTLTFTIDTQCQRQKVYSYPFSPFPFHQFSLVHKQNLPCIKFHAHSQSMLPK